MRYIYRMMLWGAAVMVLLAAVAAGQDVITEQADTPTEQIRGRFSFGGNIGAFAPKGDWAEHRYGQGVKQFSRGLFIEGILEFEIAKWGGLAITFGGGGLGTGDWVDYAASQDDEVTASARMYLFGFLFRPYLLNRPNQILKLDVGGGSISPSGSESFNNISYDYDFLYSRFVFITGLEYCHFFKPQLAVALRVGLLYADGGVQYSDGLTHSIYGMPLTIGIRFYP